MNFVDEIYSNTHWLAACAAITNNKKYTYYDLKEKMQNYFGYFSDYKRKGIDRIGIITNDKIDLETVSIILSAIKCKITPIIINEDIKDNIKDIMEKDDIKILFHKKILKPNYLEKREIIIDEEEQFFVTINPYINVKNEKKLSSLKCYLGKLKSLKPIDDCVCKLYNIKDKKIVEENINVEDISFYERQFKELENEGNRQNLITTLPLYDKNGFLLTMNALSSGMNVISCDKYSGEKNVSKILKHEPSVITVNNNMLISLYQNYKDIDLSFIKKVILDVEDENISVLVKLLQRDKFDGEYLNINNSDKPKILRYK